MSILLFHKKSLYNIENEIHNVYQQFLTEKKWCMTNQSISADHLRENKRLYSNLLSIVDAINEKQKVCWEFIKSPMANTISCVFSSVFTLKS